MFSVLVQPSADFSIPKRVEPLTTVTPTLKKNALKSATKKKKSSRKCDVKDDQVESSTQEVKKTKGKEALKDSSKVSTHAKEKAAYDSVIGNPGETLISNISNADRKLGLEDLNDVIDSTENMDIDAGIETTVNDFVEKDLEENDIGKDVGPNVETSLDQPGNSVDDTITVGRNKDPIPDTAPEKDARSRKSVENSISEEGEESVEVSKETEEENDYEDIEKDKDVVDVDNLDLDDIPLTNTLGDGVAKRLRSNKGIVVPHTSTTPKENSTSETKTPKSKGKSTVVGPKKAWSKVIVKSVVGSYRKRKVVSSSESEYEVEEDVLNIVSSDVKKSAEKKNAQIVENVPIDKVSFHLPEFTQRWKYIYHRGVAVERGLSKEAVGIKVVMGLIKEAGLIKTVCNLGDCYEKLVKEFVVNISEDCDNPLSGEFQKVYVRGECVNFSPDIINNFLGIDKEAIAELEATDNQISREVTANKVSVWPKKGNISFGKMSVKYAILNRIGATNWVPTPTP